MGSACTSGEHRDQHRRRNMASNENSSRGQIDINYDEGTEEEFQELYYAFIDDKNMEKILKGVPLETIRSTYPSLPDTKKIENIRDERTTFMNEQRPDRSDANSEYAIANRNAYRDIYDQNHVFMPCSNHYHFSNGEPCWQHILNCLQNLKEKSHNRKVTVRDLLETIAVCNGLKFNMDCLQQLFKTGFSNEQYNRFMFNTLSKICDLVMNVQSIFSEPPRLLRARSSGSITMSQHQAASLLACSFFCLYPFRHDHVQKGFYENYPNPNFDNLYTNAEPKKIEKLKCILHYFERVTEKMPDGNITFQRFTLPQNRFALWNESDAKLCDLHLTTGTKIEDIPHVLQVDFANKYIGGGVLGGGCVQEEIRFSICPEMLVSLLICEVMKTNECIFLIGCERYSSYKGYGTTFQFSGDYKDTTQRDNFGHRYCHLVAMDALYFHDPSTQYEIKTVERELLKAYTSFYPLQETRDYRFPIATGNWGCGAFRGDRQLKAIIQLMAASQVQRPLIYAAFGDKRLVNSFIEIYDYLKKQDATVSDLYYYLHRYSKERSQISLFDYILATPVSALRH